MGRCIKCQLCFCALCSYAWHGIAPCAGKMSELLQKFRAANAEEKLAMELKFGKV